MFFVPWNRETPLHQLYSSAFSKQKLQIYPTKKPALPFGELPPGYQHLHTQLQYECVSPFYRRLGSSRRTCLKTGKWSGRAPVCVPSESPREKKCAYLLGEWGNRMCIHLRYLGSHSSVGCLYFQLGERSNKAWRIYMSFYPPVELVLLMVKWSGFQHSNLPLLFPTLLLSKRYRESFSWFEIAFLQPLHIFLYSLLQVGFFFHLYTLAQSWQKHQSLSNRRESLQF